MRDSCWRQRLVNSTELCELESPGSKSLGDFFLSKQDADLARLGQAAARLFQTKER